jgi:hypothetical protein
MINLTNNPDIPSDRAIMLREGANVYSLSNTTNRNRSCRERNQTSNQPTARISTDNGASLEPML